MAKGVSKLIVITVVSGLSVRKVMLLRTQTIAKPPIIPIMTPPPATKTKCARPSNKDKWPFFKTDRARSKMTKPVASLNNDSSSKALLTPVGISVPAVSDLTATASVGTTMVAKAMANGNGHADSIQLERKPTAIAETAANKTDRVKIIRKRFLMTAKDCCWPSKNISGAITTNIKNSGSSSK